VRSGGCTECLSKALRRTGSGGVIVKVRNGPGVTLQQSVTRMTTASVGNELEMGNNRANFATLIVGRTLFLPMLVSN
jgi:hypothetical protein